MKNEAVQRSVEVRAFTLTPSTAQYIDNLLASGAYRSEDEVFGAALRALQERDAAVERWLSEDVASVIDQVQSEENNIVSAALVFASVRARYAERRRNPHEA